MKEKALKINLLKSTIKFLKQKGVDYGEIRQDCRYSEHIVIKNENVENITSFLNDGIGIRVLYKGAWGFSATPILSEASLKSTAQRALSFAKTASKLSNKKVSFPKRKPVCDDYTANFIIDPFRVPLSDKLNLLFNAESILRSDSRIKNTTAFLDLYKTDKLFVNTDGSCISQHFVEVGGGLEATAIDKNGLTQKRSYPNSHGGHITQGGFEYITSLDLIGGAKKIKKEVIELINAKPCPNKKTTVIIDGPQMALQIHESCGHPTELDRVLGEERSFAGTSFLTPDKLNKFRYGSKIVNIHANALAPKGAGSFKYDDEGTLAQDNPLITKGMFTGYLSSCQTAKAIKSKSTGAMRAGGWNMIPIIRMTNINLLPHQGTLEELIKDTKDGIFLSVNKSWSIDDKRLNFQFGCELAQEIKNGKLGRIYKNPVYTGITPVFWGNCTGICGPSEWVMWGVSNCGKGEPVQTAHVGHGTSPARFEKVEVFGR